MRFVCGYCLLHLFHIVEKAEAGRCVASLKLRTYEPYLVERHLSELVDNALMLVVAHLSQFLHITYNHHFAFGFDVGEVAQCGSHARRVGIVGIYDESVVGSLLKLRAIV